MRSRGPGNEDGKVFDIQIVLFLPHEQESFYTFLMSLNV